MRRITTITLVLTVDERRRVASLLSVLMTVDRRLQKAKKAAKSTRPSKAKYINDIKQGLPYPHSKPCFNFKTTLSLVSYIVVILNILYTMIDTIVLTLSSNSFSITKPENFEPHAGWVMQASMYRAGNIRSKQNPSKWELKSGIYKPRLTLSNRINPQEVFEPMLKIELSLPKLLFGNNFDELQYKDFKLVVARLVMVLAHMGVATNAAALSQAQVTAIHYSKNIPLVDGSTPYHFINKIKEANIKLSIDTNQTDYRNEGHSFRWHCNSYEVVFYDKIRDLEKANISSKRSIEKDNKMQADVFNKLKNRKMLEVLRMEVRLNKRDKIKQLFKSLGIKAELTFKKLFKPAISRTILLHYLDELESKRPMLLDYKARNDKALLAALVCNNPTLTPKQLLMLFGLRKAFETMDARELRVMFAKCNQRSWYRLIADANKARLPNTDTPFGVIRKHIDEFKPFSWVKYQR